MNAGKREDSRFLDMQSIRTHSRRNLRIEAQLCDQLVLFGLQRTNPYDPESLKQKPRVSFLNCGNVREQQQSNLSQFFSFFLFFQHQQQQLLLGRARVMRWEEEEEEEEEEKWGSRRRSSSKPLRKLLQFLSSTIFTKSILLVLPAEVI